MEPHNQETRNTPDLTVNDVFGFNDIVGADLPNQILPDSGYNEDLFQDVLESIDLEPNGQDISIAEAQGSVESAMDSGVPMEPLWQNDDGVNTDPTPMQVQGNIPFPPGVEVPFLENGIFSQDQFEANNLLSQDPVGMQELLPENNSSWPDPMGIELRPNISFSNPAQYLAPTVQASNASDRGDRGPNTVPFYVQESGGNRQSIMPAEAQDISLGAVINSNNINAQVYSLHGIELDNESGAKNAVAANLRTKLKSKGARTRKSSQSGNDVEMRQPTKEVDNKLLERRRKNRMAARKSRKKKRDRYDQQATIFKELKSKHDNYQNCIEDLKEKLSVLMNCITKIGNATPIYEMVNTPCSVQSSDLDSFENLNALLKDFMYSDDDHEMGNANVASTPSTKDSNATGTTEQSAWVVNTYVGDNEEEDLTNFFLDNHK